MLKSHISKKDRECKTCGRMIPKGHRYFRDYEENEFGGADLTLEHTNCELYTAEEFLWPPKKVKA